MYNTVIVFSYTPLQKCCALASKIHFFLNTQVEKEKRDSSLSFLCSQCPVRRCTLPVFSCYIGNKSHWKLFVGATFSFPSVIKQKSFPLKSPELMLTIVNLSVQAPIWKIRNLSRTKCYIVYLICFIWVLILDPSGFIHWKLAGSLRNGSQL